MEVIVVLDAVLVGQDEVLYIGHLDLGGRPGAAVGVRAGVAALAHAAVLVSPIPVGVGAHADAIGIRGPRLPPVAISLGVLVTVGVGHWQDVPGAESIEIEVNLNKSQ